MPSRTTLPIEQVHVVLPSRAPELLVAWYAHHLDFEADGTYLRSGVLCLEFVLGERSAGHVLPLRLGLSDRRALELLRERLAEDGVLISPISDDRRGARLRLVDPEGNTLELFCEHG